MKAHHLNCGTMLPPASPRMVAHCLLLETGRDLVLVDTGFAVGEDTLDAGFTRLVRPTLDPAEPALHQIRGLGLDPADVRHIVLTHLDPDHAGGLRDFPHARVHLHAAELAAATRPASANERRRYRPAQWAHGPDWAAYDDAGEDLFGLRARPLDGLEGIALVPLAGHTRGHSAVAVQTADGWLLHAGDAYYFHGELATPPRCPLVLRAAQRTVAVDHAGRLANLARLRELPPGRIEVFSAHDAQELARYQRP
ncbi:MBL fold metallo-hydrolase [Planomonospora venezuelensis]|uniref:Glyoxylase-like metal-dependent hydrolase (Beta-lactamase superfamily II) n=1 Tax=Planomonospora venezuelensis TaxID=1999 RepID=A0A841DCV5_PLAVE|nr:MBL fold metallo-hydrolase [Planomonospora venezuelensis]MBB5967900.1 glyoxylase-like metal-dependent hydrolase (beta-lactamase superfamily II) [Planomonospora venezuelensis]GIN05528.1 MBL fold metallo-hydrolase [Planomonospora venezuelensis]